MKQGTQNTGNDVAWHYQVLLLLLLLFTIIGTDQQKWLKDTNRLLTILKVYKD